MPKAEHQRGRSMALYETILKLKDLTSAAVFLTTCAPPSTALPGARFDVAVYLQQGLVYLDILEKTGPAVPPSAGSAGPCWTTAPGGVMQDVIIREGLGEPKADPEP